MTSDHRQAGYHSSRWRAMGVLPAILSYLGAMFSIAVATALLVLVRAHMSPSTVALIYLLPVLLSTTAWGLGPGLVSGFLAFLVFNYFFLKPYYSLTVHQAQDTAALVIFLMVALATSQLVGRAKRNLEAATAREQELTRLYELSLSLAGVYDVREIALVIANQVQQIFQANCVQVQIGSTQDEKAFQVQAPEDCTPPAARPALLAVLQSARGMLGEIRVWRESLPSQLAEERLLSTLATQGALALERASLAQTEQRSKVLEESDRMKSALLSSVSHELRTPLATIKASATSLLSGEVEWNLEARQELLEVIDEEADHLNRLVGNLLDMSRVEAGALKPEKQWNDLTEIIDSAVQHMRRALERHRLELDLPEDLPLVPVDYAQAERLVTNLLSNSIKYSPPGSMIAIRSHVQDQKWIFLQVTNQSPPVAEEHLGRIFDKFFRVTHAGEVSGTGLGLSICKGIVEAHQGQIWAENLPAGFAFNILLPLEWDGHGEETTLASLEEQ